LRGLIISDLPIDIGHFFSSILRGLAWGYEKRFPSGAWWISFSAIINIAISMLNDMRAAAFKGMRTLFFAHATICRVWRHFFVRLIGLFCSRVLAGLSGRRKAALLRQEIFCARRDGCGSVPVG
jgi:hypothetical protein